MEKKSFVLYTDMDAVVNELSDQQAGQLFKAILAYNRSGSVPESDPILSLIFIPIRQAMDRENTKYQAKCKKNKDNIEKRWQKKNDTTVYDGKNRNTKHTYNDPDIENDPDNEKDITPLNPPKGERKKSLRLSEMFQEFYSRYPRKVGKQPAEKAFKKIAPSEEEFRLILDGLERCKQMKQWQGEITSIPYPSTWLNQARWKDEIGEEEANGKTEQQKPKRNADGFTGYQKPSSYRDIYEV